MSDRFQIIGHRGAMGHAPENTIASVRKAIALGADGVEVDVRNVAGQPIVFHDPMLERMTNGTGPLDALTFEELRKFKVSGGEQIPTLGEVFDEVARKAFLNIELKTGGIASAVKDLIRKGEAGGAWTRDRFLVSSFYFDLLEEFRDSQMRIGCLFRDQGSEKCKAAAEHLRAFSIHPHLTAFTPEIVEVAHGEGWKVFPFTVNSLEEGRRIREMGADGAFTDFPDRLLELRS